MTVVDQEFHQRAARIPHHGLGLSVDVYQPDLFEVVEALQRAGLAYGYLEIFKAATPALAEVRRRLQSTLLEYHAEGPWATQPDGLTQSPAEAEVITAAQHTQTLGSHWANFEGASKQIAGYSFGTYLPPLFTRAGAEVSAENIVWVQRRLDQLCDRQDRRGPLFLLETPPLTYFGFGDLDMAEFFHRVTEWAPCGLVLDVGHVWTVYRYSSEWRRRSLRDFVADFLDRFPLERVVHLHVAGLAVHDGISVAVPTPPVPEELPWWIDANGAAIPEILFDMLEQILSHPRLTQAKGIALEVDNKAIPQIVQEFEQFADRFRWWARSAPAQSQSGVSSQGSAQEPRSTEGVMTRDRHDLRRQYQAYARVVAGLADPASVQLPCRWLEPGALETYRQRYLRHEILHWGGELRDMFPGTCKDLDRAGIPLDLFVDYWFREPRRIEDPYDFFLLKLDRFVEFVGERLPHALGLATREATDLRQAYQAACELAP